MSAFVPHPIDPTPPPLLTRLPYADWCNKAGIDVIELPDRIEARPRPLERYWPWFVRWPEYEGGVQIRDDIIFFAGEGDMTAWMWGNDPSINNADLRRSRQSLVARLK